LFLQPTDDIIKCPVAALHEVLHVERSLNSCVKTKRGRADVRLIYGGIVGVVKNTVAPSLAAWAAVLVPHLFWTVHSCHTFTKGPHQPQLSVKCVHAFGSPTDPQTSDPTANIPDTGKSWIGMHVFVGN